MQKLDPIQFATPAPTNALITLRFQDRVQYDPEPLRLLYEEMGHHHAEEHVCDVLENIARLLERSRKSVKMHHFEAVTRNASELSQLAQKIGLMTVAKAAFHLADAADQSDYRAVDSTFARLERVTEPSMVEVWSSYSGSP